MINKADLVGEETGLDTAHGSNRGPSRASQDHRMTANLHLYWNSLRMDRESPAFVEFDPTSIPTLWPHCLLAACAEPSRVFHLADLGPALTNEIPAPAHGLAVNTVPANTLMGWRRRRRV